MTRLPQGPVSSVAFDGVTVQVDGVALVPDWLRDNCRCDLCRIVQTDERRWEPWSASAPPRVAEASAMDGALSIVWADGHRSSFGPSDWETIDRSMRRGRFDTRHWRAGDSLERFDHDSVLADLDARRAMFHAFRQDGAAILTGSPIVPGSIIDTAKALKIPLMDTGLGFIFDVKLDPAGFNIAFTSEALPPHNDYGQSSQPPSGQILAFLANDATGGDTIVVDGWSVLDQLAATDPQALAVLSRVSVPHRQYSTESDVCTSNPLVMIDGDGRYRHLRFSNQLRQPMPFDHPELAEWYRAYRVLGSIITDPANAVTFRMNAGDSLFINGWRVLHARQSYVPDGRRHLQDVYFQADDIHGELDRLSGDAVNLMGAVNRA